MTEHDDLTRHRRYTRQETAALLNIPVTWLKVWVTEGKVPHQRSGKPGPRQRGVWFTYDNTVAIRRMLPDLHSGRQANNRAETHRNDTPAEPVADSADADEELWAQFAGLRSLRTSA